MRKTFLDVNSHTFGITTIGEQHRGHADAERVSRDGFGAVGKTAQGPARAIEAFQSLQLDEG